MRRRRGITPPTSRPFEPAAGELYILSKADGMVRMVTGVASVTSPPASG
jgi:hypothetical protein